MKIADFLRKLAKITENQGTFMKPVKSQACFLKWVQSYWKFRL